MHFSFIFFTNSKVRHGADTLKKKSPEWGIKNHNKSSEEKALLKKKGVGLVT